MRQVTQSHVLQQWIAEMHSSDDDSDLEEDGDFLPGPDCLSIPSAHRQSGFSKIASNSSDISDALPMLALGSRSKTVGRVGGTGLNRFRSTSSDASPKKWYNIIYSTYIKVITWRQKRRGLYFFRLKSVQLLQLT